MTTASPETALIRRAPRLGLLAGGRLGAGLLAASLIRQSRTGNDPTPVRVVGGGWEAGRMNGDEQLLRGRVYGCDHDDPNPGPLPQRTYATLVGGPLDGLLLDITGWTAQEVDGGVALSTELSRWPGGRALYDPNAGEPRIPGPGVACRFHYSGDTP